MKKTSTTGKKRSTPDAKSVFRRVTPPLNPNIHTRPAAAPVRRSCYSWQVGMMATESASDFAKCYNGTYGKRAGVVIRQAVVQGQLPPSCAITPPPADQTGTTTLPAYHAYLSSAGLGAENLCHQAILMDHACCAVTPPDPEMVQVGDAVGQWAERRGLLQARPVSAGSMGLSLPRGQ